MPRTIGAGLEAHKQSRLTTLARCVKLKRVDGTVLGFTELDEDLAIDLGDGDGMVTYEAKSAVSLNAIRRAVGLSPDTGGMEGILDSDRIDDRDLRAGLYNFAEIVAFETNYANLAQGVMELADFRVGRITLTDGKFTAELRPKTDFYDTNIVRIVQPACDANLGDTRCKVRLDPPAWAATTAYTVRQSGDAATGSVVRPTAQNGRHFRCSVAGTSGGTEPTWDTTIGNPTTDGTATWIAIKALSQAGTVSAVADRSNFDATGISLGSDWWKSGRGAWLTGDNAGLAFEVKADDGAGGIELLFAAPYAIQVSDTFRIFAGCDKIHHVDAALVATGDCKTKFDNVFNFRGFDRVPGQDVSLSYPDG